MGNLRTAAIVSRDDAPELIEARVVEIALEISCMHREERPRDAVRLHVDICLVGYLAAT